MLRFNCSAARVFIIFVVDDDFQVACRSCGTFRNFFAGLLSNDKRSNSIINYKNDERLLLLSTFVQYAIAVDGNVKLYYSNQYEELCSESPHSNLYYAQ